MKRIFSCLLAFVLLVTIFVQTSVTASAGVVPISETSAEPTFTVSAVPAHPGQTVSVPIRIDHNPGVASVKLKVQYDSALVLDSVTYNDGLGGRSQQPQKLTSPVTLNWFNGAENTTGDMVFATLKFSVSENAAAGLHAVTITYDPDDVYNIAEDNIDFGIVNGGVNVTIPAKGLALDPQTATVSTGDLTCVLTPVFTPSNTTNQNVSWQSSDEAVATVNDGVVTLLKKGNVVITATSEDGGFEATCTLTVLCSHLHTEDVPSQASSCIEHGHAAYTVCSECGEIVSGSDEPLLFGDHQYEENPLAQYLKSAATCSSPAVYYVSCSVCGEQGTDTFTFGEVDPDHHTYGEPVWTWNGYESATAVFTCTNGDDEKTFNAVITSKVTVEPSASADGERTYTATVTFGDLTYTNTEKEVLPREALLGDVDGDGKVDIFDVSSIQKSLAGKSGYVKYDTLEKTDFAFLIADVDKNGNVDIFDASLIQKWMAGNAAAQHYGIGEPF